ncbi:hypothetical protein ACLOJK_015578 [Asimina triloba]
MMKHHKKNPTVPTSWPEGRQGDGSAGRRTLDGAGAEEGGKTGRWECGEADAGRSRRQRMEEGGGMEDPAGRMGCETSLEDGPPEMTDCPDGRRSRSWRRREAGGKGGAGRETLDGAGAGEGGNRERETGPPGGRRWMEPEPEKEGRTQAEDGSAVRRETSRTEDETQAEDARRRRREEGGLGELSLEDEMGGSENGFRAMGRKEGICASEAHGARRADSINGSDSCQSSMRRGETANVQRFESRSDDRQARKTSGDDLADGRMLLYDGRV